MRLRKRKSTQRECEFHPGRAVDSDGRCEWDREIEREMSQKLEVGDRVRYTQTMDPLRPSGLVGTVTGFDTDGDPFVRPDDTNYPRFLGTTEEFELARDLIHSTNTVTLDASDPFERVIIDMVETNRRKRADYAVDGSPWSNFDDTANALGIDGFNPVDSANFNIEQKSARLRSLRKNGRMDDPANESVSDTYLDRAVYAVIALAMFKYPSGKVE